ncbi:MAG TPA: glycosyltransferase family 4 protein [Limnochordales bacterium]
MGVSEGAQARWPGQAVMVVPYLGLGGTEYHVLHLVQSILWGRPPLVVAPDGPLRRELEAAGARVLTFVDPTGRWIAGLRSFREVADRVLRLWEDGRPGVVHVHGSAELLLLARRWLGGRGSGGPRAAFVFTSHGYFGSGATWSYRVAGWALRRTRTPVVAVSHQEARRLVAAGVAPEQVQVIPNGIPDPLGQASQPWPFGPGSPRLLSVGRLVEQKGMRELVEAFERVAPEFPGARLVIVGSGPLKESLERRIRSSSVLSERVHLAGPVAGAARLLACADVFCLASRDEAFPLTILEALGAGKAIVSTRAGGIPEAVKDGESGLLVPPGDVEALARALRRVMADAELRRRLGEAARRRYLEHFTARRMAERTVAVYHQAASGASSRR